MTRRRDDCGFLWLHLIWNFAPLFGESTYEWSGRRHALDLAYHCLCNARGQIAIARQLAAVAGAVRNWRSANRESADELGPEDEYQMDDSHSWGWHFDTHRLGRSDFHSDGCFNKG
jgi:hypothetical protein